MNPKRILLIENELLVAEHLTQMLTKQGHQILGVEATGPEGVVAVLNAHPDLVLMNVRLTGPMDGYETARQIRLTSEVPILFVTAQSEHTVRAHATGLNVQGCITKPFSARQIYEAIQTIFAEKIEGATA